MKIISRLSNGVLLIILGFMHTQFGLSSSGFGNQFRNFSQTYFFKICKGVEELPAVAGKTDFEALSAFWFFYFGILIFPLGLLVYSVEKEKKILPYSFTISYLIVILIGSYMVPNSGMTYLMLPHAIYMLLINVWKAKVLNSKTDV